MTNTIGCAKLMQERLGSANRRSVLTTSALSESQVTEVNLSEAIEGKEYVVKEIETDDEELNAFLFSLGCFSGETITVIAHRKSGCVVSIKDGRYNIDAQLAQAIKI